MGRRCSHAKDQPSYSWGNVAASYQNHAAAATTSDPSVQYAYAKPGDTGSGNADPVSVRLATVTYPGGRVVHYNYGSEGSIGDVLNRIDNIAASVMPADADIYAQYAYLGAGTIVRVSRPSGATGGQADGLTLDYDSGGAHTYAGWDRFGRVVNQQWTTATGGIVDQYRYGYDIAGNRIWRQVGPDMATPPSGLDELYSYDELSRLIETQRGDLDLTGTPSIEDQTDGQEWDLDLLGNWQSTTQFCGPIQYRDHDDANQITSIDESGDQVAYDAAGNMIKMPAANNPAQTHHAVYDAWNRMTKVYLDDGDRTFEPTTDDTLIATYEYDGQRRRIVADVEQAFIPAGEEHDVTDFYYNENWQVVEERGTDTAEEPVDPSTTEYLWDIRYIDAPVIRWHDGDSDGNYADTGDNILYYTNDANMSVTSLVDATTGSVVERYQYTLYGEVTVLNPDWTPDSGNSSDVGNLVLYDGYRYDSETGLELARWRYTTPALGRWVQRDPAGFTEGLSLYQYLASSPTDGTDSTGLGKFYTVIKLARTASGKVCRSWARKMPEEVVKRMAQLAKQTHLVGAKVVAWSKTEAKTLAKSGGRDPVLHKDQYGEHFHSVLEDGTLGRTHFTWKDVVLVAIPGTEAVDLGVIWGEVQKGFVADIRKGTSLRAAESLTPEMRRDLGDLYDDVYVEEVSQKTIDEFNKYAQWAEYSREEAIKYLGWAMYDWNQENDSQAEYNWTQYEKHNKDYDWNMKKVGSLFQNMNE